MRIVGLGASICALALAVSATPAGAAVITRTFHFTATDFQPLNLGGDAAPHDHLDGAVTITFDPSVLDVPDSTTNILLRHLDIPYTPPVGWIYDRGSGTIDFGGETCGGAGGVCGGQDDFAFEFFDLTGPFDLSDPLFPTVAIYSVAAFPNEEFTGGQATVTMTAAPEPATWGMMILGLGLLGRTSRARRTVRRA
jgi:hypothetical protein